jgi:hypothetical protein
VLTREGCNSGQCHGAAIGQGGFRLSLLGYDPEADYAAIVREFEGRRVNVARPERSLLLLKPTNAVAHGGGARFAAGSPAHRRILAWIRAGMPARGTRRLAGVTVAPGESLLPKPGAAVQLNVVARYSDGTREDVTRWALFSSNDEGMATVDAGGRVTARRRGATAIMVRYLGQVKAARVAVPLGERPLSLVRKPAANLIDVHVQRQLARMRIPPSPLADDATFLRRVSLDLTGTLPTPEETRAFLLDRPGVGTERRDSLRRSKRADLSPSPSPSPSPSLSLPRQSATGARHPLAPLAGTRPRQSATGAPPALHTVTAVDGIFFLTGLPPGDYTITAGYGGFESASIAGHPVRSGDPSLAAAPPVLLALRRSAQGAPDNPPRAGQAPDTPGQTLLGEPLLAATAAAAPVAIGALPAHLEARVRWETRGDLPHPGQSLLGAKTAPAGDPVATGEPASRPAFSGDRFVVVELHRYPGPMPRQRAPELSEEQLLVVGVDARGQPRDWALVADPGLVRAESPDARGRLQGETHRLAETEFLVTLPAGPAIAELRFYRPRWMESRFALELLGGARFPTPPAGPSERPDSLTPSPER